MHIHTKECYLCDNQGLVYTPCRADGLDRNLRHLKDVDFYAGFGRKGLTLICTEALAWNG